MTRTEPTRHLYEGHEYTPAVKTDIRLRFAREMLKRAAEQPDSLAPLLIASIELARAKKAQK